jgi:uncharacterized protein (TIGR02246 family)
VTPLDPSAAIAAAAAELDQALVANDAQRTANLFTQDAILGESGMADLIGRPAIQQFLAVANQKRQVSHHRLTRDELILLGDDRAIELGRFEETKVIPGQAPIDEWGRTVTFWRRESDGAWRVERLVVSDLPSPKE